jgi:hypothetical protein
MMTHQHPPELTGIDLPALNPAETDSLDELFVQHALKSGDMTTEQLQDCLREKQVMESPGTHQTMIQICIRKGYLSEKKMNQVLRKRRYEKVRHQDLEIGRAAVKQKIVEADQVRLCMRIQEFAFQHGNNSIPRLVQLLGDRGLVDTKSAMNLLDAVCQVDNRSKSKSHASTMQKWAWDKKTRNKHESRRIMKRDAERFSVPEAYLRYRVGLFPFFKEDSEYTPMIDVSRTGLQFLSREQLRNKDSLHMELILPAFAEKLQIKGRVRWTDRAGMTALYRVGVTFGKLTKDIANYLKKLEEDPFLRATGRSPYRLYW